MYPFRLQEQCYITALHNNLCFLGSSSTFCLYKLLPWKAVLIKITESTYELWMSLSFPFFNPLILVWKCCVTNASLYIAYGFSVALSTGNRSCSWVRYRVLSHLRARWSLHIPRIVPYALYYTLLEKALSVCLEKCWIKIT